MPNVFRVQQKRSKIAVTFVDRAVGFRSASLWLVESKPFFGNHTCFWLLGPNYHEDERISEFGMQEKTDPAALWTIPYFTLNVSLMKPRKDLSRWTRSMAPLPFGHFWQLRACSLVSLLLKQLLPVVQPSWGGAECIASCYHSGARRQQSKSPGPDRLQWGVKVSSSSS